MSAEQHNRPFSIDYQPELRQPVFATLMESLSFWRKHPPIRELDIASVYTDILELKKKYGRENALLAGLLRFALDLWALQQEMTGRRHTQELSTAVTIEDGNVVFQNKRYPKGTNLQKMYEASLEHVTDEKIARYKRENDQIFSLYSHLESQIRTVHAKLNEDDSVDSLLSMGFTWHEIVLTPSLIATIPSLFSSLTSMDDLYEIMRSGKIIRVLMAPEHLLTLSPQHWLHKKAQSTFWWNTRLIVFPETKETAIIQNGIFSHTPLMDSLDFLAYGQSEKKKFRSEQELMQFINVVTDATTIHPSILLDMIVDQVDLFSDAQKIDPNIKEGVLDVEPYMRAVEELLRFEIARIEADPEFEKGIEDRLLIATGLIQHKVARLNPIEMMGIVDTYKGTFGPKRRAIAPLRQKQPFHQAALKLDPGLGIKIDFSLIDCTVGTAFNGIQNLSNLSIDKLSIAIDARFGTGAGEFLQKSSREGIRSRSQLSEFCHRFDLDEHRFHEGKCRVNGCPSTFVGECDVCPACEMLDNFGIARDWAMQENLSPHSLSQPSSELTSARRMGLSDFVAGLGNPDLMWKTFLIQQLISQPTPKSNILVDDFSETRILQERLLAA